MPAREKKKAIEAWGANDVDTLTSCRFHLNDDRAGIFGPFGGLPRLHSSPSRKN